MRKSYSAEFKAKVVQEILKEEQTIAQIAAAYEVHPNQVIRWKAMALEGMTSLFARDDQAGKAKVAHEQQVEALHAEIGRLTMQVAWLEKKGGSVSPRGAVGYGRVRPS